MWQIRRASGRATSASHEKKVRSNYFSVGNRATTTATHVCLSFYLTTVKRASKNLLQRQPTNVMSMNTLMKCGQTSPVQPSQPVRWQKANDYLKRRCPSTHGVAQHHRKNTATARV